MTHDDQTIDMLFDRYEAMEQAAPQVATAPATAPAPAPAQPTMRCPHCRRVYDDFDGIGVVYCAPPDGCGYCKHAARKDGVCEYCGHVRLAPAAAPPPPASAPAQPPPTQPPPTLPPPEAMHGAADQCPGDGYAPRVPLDEALPTAEMAAQAEAAADDADHGGALAAAYGVPPFTVLDARQGYWQARKRAWVALGIKSELGRGAGGPGLCFGTGQGSLNALSGAEQSGTSIFDPVLCEMVYLWFCPQGGTVLDPFAGGSVRGIVAAKLGRAYTGIELRPEQVAANVAQWAAMDQATLAAADGSAPAGPAVPPRWIAGDSRAAATLAPGAYDMVLSCPPYGDLEKYSKDPRDLSTLAWPAFVEAYRAIITGAVALLKPDRFACFVVGDYRRADGCYQGFVQATVDAFATAGCGLYNQAVLVTAVGSLPIRTAAQFTAGRKLGKGHQDCLVFVKGDGKRAAAACGAVQPLAIIPEAAATLMLPGF